MALRRGYTPDVSLSNLYSDADLEDMVILARHRICHAFDTAVETHRGVTKGTDHYIGGVGRKQKDLASYVMGSVSHHFVTLKSLPVEAFCALDGLDTPYEQDVFVQGVQYKLIALAVESLVAEHSIWFDECGLWNILPSTLDEWRKSRTSSRKALKHDRRNYHGKPREQSKRRGIPPGAANSALFGTAAAK